jgi:von Willebrand factor A domain-containing protein 8
MLNNPLTELINLVKHMQAYPEDSLEDAIRNVFDFDIYRRDTMRALLDILEHHK